MITSFQFARMLAAELRGGAVTTVEYLYYRVTGRLDIGARYVSVEIRVWQDFSVLKRVPPAVWCYESWMREGADWHNSRTDGLCWILEQLWCDAMSWKGKPARVILEEGRSLLVEGVRCLISRHYTATLEGLTRWPKEWDYWSHGESGAMEYNRQKQLEEKGMPGGRYA